MEDLASAAGLLNRWAPHSFSLSSLHAMAPVACAHSFLFSHAQSHTARARSVPPAQTTAPRLFAFCPTTRTSTSPRCPQPFLVSYTTCSIIPNSLTHSFLTANARAPFLRFQDTWSSFNSMLRIMKIYNFSFAIGDGSEDTVAGQLNLFSSYPGRSERHTKYGKRGHFGAPSLQTPTTLIMAHPIFNSLFSGDDFYLLGSGLAVIETTIGTSTTVLSLGVFIHPASISYPRLQALISTTTTGNSNPDLDKYIVPQTVLEWLRNIVSNRLAADGQDWYKVRSTPLTFQSPVAHVTHFHCLTLAPYSLNSLSPRFTSSLTAAPTTTRTTFSTLTSSSAGSHCQTTR